MGSGVVITLKNNLVRRVPTVAFTRTKWLAGMSSPLATRTLTGVFNGKSRNAALRTTSALMNESDAPESSKAKWVEAPILRGRNIKGIGGGGSFTSSLINDEAFSHVA